MSLEHGADLLAIIECWFDTNRLGNECHVSSGTALRSCFKGYAGHAPENDRQPKLRISAG